MTGVYFIYLVCRSDPPEIRHVCNGTHRESLVDQSIVDKHVGHAKHRNSKALREDIMSIRGTSGAIFVMKYLFYDPDNLDRFSQLKKRLKPLIQEVVSD